MLVNSICDTSHAERLSKILGVAFEGKYRQGTSHSAYVATATESIGVKIDGLLPPFFL